jgi:hypothetical protein
MGALNYLVNHKKKQIFSLGKGISASAIAECKTPEELTTALEYWMVNCVDKDWRDTIYQDIISTIGLEGNEGMTDVGNDELLQDCYLYTIVGSVYTEDEDIDHPYIHNFRSHWEEFDYTGIERATVDAPEGFTLISEIQPPIGIYLDFVTPEGKRYRGCSAQLGTMPPSRNCQTVFVSMQNMDDYEKIQVFTAKEVLAWMKNNEKCFGLYGGEPK